MGVEQRGRPFPIARPEQVVDSLIRITLRLVIVGGQQVVPPALVETGQLFQKVVEDVMVAQAAVAEIDDEQVDTPQIGQHGGAGGPNLKGVARFGGDNAQDRCGPQKLLHVGRLSFKDIRRQQVEQCIQRGDLVGENVLNRIICPAAQALPHQLQGDGPALGCLMEQIGFFGRQRVTVGVGEEGGDLGRCEGQVSAVDLPHHPLRLPTRQVGQRKRLAAGQDDVQIGWGQGHQPVDQVSDLRRVDSQMHIVEHEQRRPVEAEAEAVEPLIEDARRRQWPAGAVPRLQQGDGQLAQAGQGQSRRMTEMEQEDQRVTVFFHDLIPQERPPQPGQRCGFAEAGAGLHQRQPVGQRLGQQPRDTNALQCARPHARRSDLGTYDGVQAAHDG